MSDEKELFDEAPEQVSANGAAVDESADATVDVSVDGAGTLEERLAAAEATAAENLEGWQRALAELANARKRFNQQSQNAYRNATAEVVAKLLPAIDDFERAVANVPEGVAADSWFEGVTLVLRKMQKLLADLNVESIDAVGQPFDPNLHEALSQEPSDEYASGTVTREMLTGYRLGERVIRPSLVFVAE